MELQEEYHDPDYSDVPVRIKEEVPVVSEDGKIETIKQIIRREFKRELDVREDEVTLIDQRMTTARRYLHQLRYTLVNNYYREQKLQINSSQIEEEVAAQTEPRARADVSTILRDSQRGLHPSVRKLLGKKTADLDEIFRSRVPRKKTRVDYSAMVHAKNVTISADTTKSLRPPTEEPFKTEEEEAGSSKPKKVPRHIDPKCDNVLTLDRITRNKQKHCYRIIIGNTSKYMPAASRADRSTHKWLLYVRGPPQRPDVSRVVSAVTVRLHHSYAPHHVVRVDKPPFQVSRRGWGEFPARLTLEFAMPQRNRPATLSHTIKLDRNYTGLQTLGAETVVDVWLYSTPEMIEFEHKTDTESTEITGITGIKSEPHTEVSENKESQTDEWLNFFTNATTEVNVDEMLIKNVKLEAQPEEEIIEENENQEYKEPEINQPLQEHVINGDHEINRTDEVKQNNVINKRIVKYMDPSTRKIYYLEMDRALDLNKIQEIVIDSQGDVRTVKVGSGKANGLRHVRKKKSISLLKPEVKNQLKSESKVENVVMANGFDHIQHDHCYCYSGRDWCPVSWHWSPVVPKLEPEDGSVKDVVNELHRLKIAIAKLSCARMIVSYLLKRIPLVSEKKKYPDFVTEFPFVVESDEKYWKLDFTKRRNIEWSRSKLINKILTEKFKDNPERVWRTKQILIYSRLHGFYPIRPEVVQKELEKPDITNEWSSLNDLESLMKSESNIRELYPKSSDLCSLTVFNSDSFVSESVNNTLDSCDSDEDIDIVSDIVPVRTNRKVSELDESLTALPVTSDDRLRYLFIEKHCADIGIELRNENVGNGYSYSAVHSVLLTAMKCFAEDVIRAGLADQLAFPNDPQLPTIWIGSSSRSLLRLEHVYRAVVSEPRLRVLAGAALATHSVRTQAL